MNDDEAKTLIRWMGWFFDNCATDISFSERAAGNEETILQHFKDRQHPWESAAGIQEGYEPARDAFADSWFAERSPFGG